MCLFCFVQAEEGSDEVHCQVVLVPETEVRIFYFFLFHVFTLVKVVKKETNLSQLQKLRLFST